MPMPYLAPAPLVLAAFACVAPASAVATEFDFGGYHIEVAADDSAVMSTTDYQVTVANSELTLTRLTAPYEGTLSNSFVADLDRNGAFEVVVTFSAQDGARTGLHVYTWKDYLLERLDIAPLDAGQPAGYRGGDQIAVVNGELVRIYQLYEDAADGPQPTAAQQRLRYSFADARWLPAP